MLINELTETISLAGEWQFQPGFDSPWSTIQVPGCWEAQGYSKFVEGPVTYRRSLPIPSAWTGKTIQLEFDALSYAAQFRLNGLRVGEHQGMWTPFALDVSEQARPGEENRLEIRVEKPGMVDNPSSHYPVRSSLAGFIPDIATSFGGLWQPARLRVLEAAIQELHLVANYETGSFQLSCRSGQAGSGTADQWRIDVLQADQLVLRQNHPYNRDGTFEAQIKLPEADCWAPEQPILYTVQVSLLRQGKLIARTSHRTGFRRLSTQGNQLLLNGKPFQVRGILSWGWEPDRIAPVYSREQAQAEMRRVRAHGFNLIKLCLFVPNPDFFDVADEEGMLLWQEFPMWLPQVTSELRARAPQEYQEMMALTRQHPSVVLYSLGCELNRSVDGELLQALDRVVRSSATGALICDNSGSGESYGGLEIDFADFSDYHPYYDIQFFEPLLDNWRRDWQPPRPWIFGEFCDSDTFRDPESIIAANGDQLPWWLTAANPVTTWRAEAKVMLEAPARLAQAALPFTTEAITRASRLHSQVIRKYTLECLRKRAGIGGYIITGLRDTPISISGIWDDFARPKWPAEEFLAVNGKDGLVLEIGRRRTWRHGGDRPDHLDVHCFRSGEGVTWHVILQSNRVELPAGSRMDWRLENGAGETFTGGQVVSQQRIPGGIPAEVGAIACTLPVVDRGQEFCLRVSIDLGAERLSNQWPIWAFPALQPLSPEVVIYDPGNLLEDADTAYPAWFAGVPRLTAVTESLPTGALTSSSILLATGWAPWLLAFLREGGRLLFLQQGSGPLPAQRCPFWREAIQLFDPHPVWDQFPQRGFTDMQFFGLASDTAFLSQRFQELIPDISQVRPVLRRLDAREYRLSDYLVEAVVGGGLLLACSLRLQGGLGAQPSGFRRNVAGSALLQVMLDYLSRSS